MKQDHSIRIAARQIGKQGMLAEAIANAQKELVHVMERAIEEHYHVRVYRDDYPGLSQFDLEFLNYVIHHSRHHMDTGLFPTSYRSTYEMVFHDLNRYNCVEKTFSEHSWEQAERLYGWLRALDAVEQKCAPTKTMRTFKRPDGGMEVRGEIDFAEPV